MSLKRDYRRSLCSKLLDAGGGWRCPCCNPYRISPRKMKVLARRRLRRIVKLSLQSQNNNKIHF